MPVITTTEWRLKIGHSQLDLELQEFRDIQKRVLANKLTDRDRQIIDAIISETLNDIVK